MGIDEGNEVGTTVGFGEGGEVGDELGLHTGSLNNRFSE